jgi:two-component system OmpR family sensor kinase
MKSPFKSIQWRLQVWHGAILLGVLAAFFCTGYQLLRETRFRLIDQELEHHAHELIEIIAPLPENPDFLKLIQGLLSGKAPRFSTNDFSLGSRGNETNLNIPMMPMNPVVALKNASFKEPNDYYFVFWEADGTVIRHSQNSPPNIPPPSPETPSGPSVRMRGDLREHLLIGKVGFMGMVGRSIAPDIADLHRQSGLMILMGLGIAGIGLIGGRWLAARAVKPINDISAAVQKITSGNLAQRINVANTDNELGQLAADLNGTFDRLQSAFSQLQGALERQTQFTADASHELRTPVAVILAEANSALARERTPEDYREAMEACRRAARRMHRLTESLLTLARLDSGAVESEPKPCALNTVMQEMLDLLRPLAEENGMSLHAEFSAATVMGDANQLGQVISNLVSNAIFYNQPGGYVRVKLGLVGEQIELTVADDGQGISAVDLPHIFDRFYRADQSRSQASGHAGLGLAITKAIVESHRGTIHATSLTGQGSTFVVRLPNQNPQNV